MKLKLGLLLTALIVAQAPIQAGLFSQSISPEQQRDIVGKNVQDYLAQQKTQGGAVSQGALQPLPDVTPEQQKIYDNLLVHISTIGTTLSKNIIPAVIKAVARGGFGFMDATTLAVSAGPALGGAIYGAQKEIRALHNTNPKAKAIIKNNLAKSFNAIGLQDIVAQLTGLLNKLPDGVVKDQLLEYAPKLTELPDLISSLL